METFLKNLSEEDVINILRNYVPKHQFDEFINENRAEVTKIRYGVPSKVLTFTKFGTNETYEARAYGIQQVNMNDGGSFRKLALFYKKEKLDLSDTANISGYVHKFTPEEITQLKEAGRINGLVTFQNDKGDSFKRFVAIDLDLNRMTFMPDKAFRAPEVLKNVHLTKEQQESLNNGLLTNFEYKKNPADTFSIKATIYYDPVESTIKFTNFKKYSGVKIHDLSDAAAKLREQRDRTMPIVKKSPEKTEVQKNEKSSALKTVEESMKNKVGQQKSRKPQQKQSI